ncbi:MAG TPA: acetyl-CoA C-acyltransferase [Candidatus Acidoferrum sp.]|nr:acetyl-CoA C-acyltransferase [Candidatus Acidoferrum sp.]
MDSIWLLPGLRTPFAKSGGSLANYDAIEISIPVVQAMVAQLHRSTPDFAVWGTVLPNLAWSNIAREVLLDAKVDPTIPAFSTIMACSTSMIGALEAASMLNNGARSLALVGGTESLSHVQVGLTQSLSDWLRGFLQARGLDGKLQRIGALAHTKIGLYIPAIANRATGKSMGQHMEESVKALGTIGRAAQDAWSLQSHRNAVAGWERGFFSDLVVPFGGIARDTIPRPDTSLERLARLAPAFDRQAGTITAGNSSPLTDGAAGLWIASDAGLSRLPHDLPRAKLVDWEIASIDLWVEGLLMAPAYAIPRMLARQNLRYGDIALWEIHEAFAAQVLAHIALLEDRRFLRERVGVDRDFGSFPRERVNPNGGSIALGHPFGATGARILSQAVKELAMLPPGSRAIVSICADGGEGTVALLEAV